MKTITIPFKRRDYQKPLTDFILNGGKRAFVLWHRRAGKDLCLWNLMIRMASQKKGLYYYFLPTYTQGKKIIWDGITNDGEKFLDFLPKELEAGSNSQELKKTLKNGSIIQIIGTDSYDSIRGTNPIGCVFSEYAFQNPQAWEVVKPILKVNGGWCVFNTTPNGKNHAFKMAKMANDNEDWFFQKLTIGDTELLNEEDMEQERREGMTEEMIQQEYYCSFDVGSVGAIYAKYVNDSRGKDRICAVEHEFFKETHLYLDLGKNDATAIIFAQRIGKEIHIIDYYQASGEDISHYIEALKGREGSDGRAYQYGTMYLPHDAFAKRLESNKTIAEQFEEGGFNIQKVELASVTNGIEQVRKMFPRFWFDKERTEKLIDALENYRYEYDDKKKVFKKEPFHDWASHPADALRYLAVSWQDVEYIRPLTRKRASFDPLKRALSNQLH